MEYKRMYWLRWESAKKIQWCYRAMLDRCGDRLEFRLALQWAALPLTPDLQP